jgi:hypothetical protein
MFCSKHVPRTPFVSFLHPSPNAVRMRVLGGFNQCFRLRIRYMGTRTVGNRRLSRYSHSRSLSVAGGSHGVCASSCCHDYFMQLSALRTCFRHFIMGALPTIRNGWNFRSVICPSDTEFIIALSFSPSFFLEFHFRINLNIVSVASTRNRLTSSVLDSCLGKNK